MPIFVKEIESGKYSFYGSLPALFADYPELKRKRSTLEKSLSKVPYIDDVIEIYRGELVRSKREG